MEKRTVLFVDDEESVLSALARVLQEEPYHTLFAHSGREALEILARNPVHVLVTDIRMPQMSGLGLLQTVRERHPRIIRMVLSGYVETATVLTAINQGEIFRFLPKPWKSNEELKITIRQAIEFYELHSEREMLMQFFELWVEGVEPDSINIDFLRELVAGRKKHLYEWRDQCGLAVPIDQ
jgi:two-component system response regulator HupR/HoxA